MPVAKWIEVILSLINLIAESNFRSNYTVQDKVGNGDLFTAPDRTLWTGFPMPQINPIIGEESITSNIDEPQNNTIINKSTTVQNSTYMYPENPKESYIIWQTTAQLSFDTKYLETLMTK